MIAESYWRSFETPVVVLRPFNTFGPRQSARAFLPTVITQALTGDEIKVGSLDPVRDMNYVEDTVGGFLRAGSAPGIEGLTINVGSGRGVTMRALLDLVLAEVGKDLRVVVEEARIRPEKSEVMELIGDASLAREKLGWRPKVTLEEGVSRTVRWIGDHLGDYKPHLYNV